MKRSIAIFLSAICKRYPGLENSLSNLCRRRITPGILLIVIVVAVILLIGCQMFSTRDPETPTGNQTGGEIANSPDEVIERLSNAITLRDPDLFIQMIDAEFSYSATPSAYPENPEIFDGWGYEKENNFIRRLLNFDLLPQDSTAKLEFENISEELFADSAKYTETYSLEIGLSRNDLPHLYKGSVELTIGRSADGGWKVLFWRDDVSGDIATMSRLRAIL